MNLDLEKINSVMVFSNGELIGDGLVKLPFVLALRNLFPKSHITWLTRQGCVYDDILKDFHNLDRIITKTRLGSSWTHLVKSPFRNLYFDLIINTEPRYLRVLSAKKIPHNFFYSSYKNFFLSSFHPIFPQPKNPHDVLENLLWHLSNIKGQKIDKFFPKIKIPDHMLEQAKYLLPEENDKYIGIAPGSGGRQKCWNLENYINLGILLIKLGFKPVYLIGPQELEWYPIIKNKIPDALFPLQLQKHPISAMQTIAFCKRLKFGIANDAGLCHLIAAAQTPIFVLYGPTSPTHFIPNTDKFYPITPQVLNVSTLQEISVDQVLKKIKQFL